MTVKKAAENRIQLYLASQELGMTSQRYKKFAEDVGVELIRVGDRVFIDVDDHEKIKSAVREAEDMTGLAPLHMVAERYGMNTESFRRYITAKGFDVHNRFWREGGRWILAVGEDAVRHIEERFEVPDAGYLAIRVAAKRIGVPLRGVIDWMKKNGKEVRYWNTPTSRKAYVLVGDWEEYVSSEFSDFVPPHLAASHYGETTTAIRMLVDKNGIPTRGGTFVNLSSLEPIVKSLPKHTPRKNSIRNSKMGIDELSALIKRSIVLKGEAFARALYSAHVEWRLARGQKVLAWEDLAGRWGSSG